MLGFSKRMLYAIEAVIDIAYNSDGAPVQSAEIANRQGIQRRYLEPVLQRLVRDGILSGVRGPKGGYHLSKDRRRITLGDIARVVADLEGADGEAIEAVSSELGRKVVQPLCQRLRSETMERLDQITIEELCLSARGQGVESEVLKRLDYSI